MKRLVFFVLLLMIGFGTAFAVPITINTESDGSVVVMVEDADQQIVNSGEGTTRALAVTQKTRAVSLHHKQLAQEETDEGTTLKMVGEIRKTDWKLKASQNFNEITGINSQKDENYFHARV